METVRQILIDATSNGFWNFMAYFFIFMAVTGFAKDTLTIIERKIKSKDK